MSYQQLKGLPVYKKSLELRLMSREIASFVTANKDLLTLYKSNSLRDHIADSLLTDAILIPQQIAKVETSTSEAIRQSCIRYINSLIRNINSYCKGLEMDGVREQDYLNLLRSETKSFRRSFKKWRKKYGEQF